MDGKSHTTKRRMEIALTGVNIMNGRLALAPFTSYKRSFVVGNAMLFYKQDLRTDWQERGNERLS